MKINVLCIGDIVGRPGRLALADELGKICEAHSIDCVIANAENSAGGSGITSKIYGKIINYGVNIITLGDHVYRKKDIVPILETCSNIAKPANLSATAAGKEYAIYTTAKGVTIAAVSLLGRVFMKPANCPFHKIDDLLPKLKREADVIIVEVHAEATSEKAALGYYLDGSVSLIYGTHTHVATADEQILPKGSGFITDIGMTGSHHSVLGRKIDNVVKSMKTQMPYPFEVANEAVRISGIIATIDSNSKRTESIKRVQIKVNSCDTGNYDSDDGRFEPMGNF